MHEQLSSDPASEATETTVRAAIAGVAAVRQRSTISWSEMVAEMPSLD